MDERQWRQFFQGIHEHPQGLQHGLRVAITRGVSDGHLPHGSRLPSLRALARELGIAKNTVQLAYERLVEDGYLVPSARSGYLVNTNAAVQRVALAQAAGRAARPVDWSTRFAARASVLRCVEKPRDWQRFRYPFLYGQSDPTLFPKAEWREACTKALSLGEIAGWAPDHVDRDDPLLVDEIRNRVIPRRGFWAAEDEVVVTVGAQQAIFLIGQVLVDERTRVGIEDPGYPDARNVFRLRGARVVAVPLDGEGVRPGDDASALDYLYVTPSHHFPTTVTMSLARRHQLLDWARASDAVIIEDDYEAEIAVETRPSPALKSLDDAGRVIYIGSLSKTFAPGLRLGFVVAPAPLAREIRAMRRLMVRHPSSYVQRAFAVFISLGHYDACLRRIGLAYRARLATLSSALRAHLPETAFDFAGNGSALWLRLPAGHDSSIVAAAAARRGVLFEAGQVFFAAESDRRHLRLGISAIRQELIDDGVRALALAVRECRAPAIVGGAVTSAT